MATEDVTDGTVAWGGDGSHVTVGVERHYIISDTGFLWEAGRIPAESFHWANYRPVNWTKVPIIKPLFHHSPWHISVYVAI